MAIPTRYVKPFYAPISAGSMAHTGPVPHANISYHVISPIRAGGLQRVHTSSPLPAQPIMTPRGHMPVSLQPVHVPRANPVWGPNGPNTVNPHNI